MKTASDAPPWVELDLGVDLACWFTRIGLGPAETVGSLAIHPLLLEGEAGASYLLLEEALATRALEIVETTRGNVQVVIARNVGDRPVFLLEGDSIAGAKQNRLLAVDVLVAAHAEVPVYVGCVEQGRWDAGARPFAAAKMAVEPQIRRAGRIGMAADGRPNQARIWGEVAHTLRRSGMSSATGDYHALSERYADRAAAVASSLSRGESQVGILATDHGALVGFDLLGHPRNWSAVAHRLASSYALGSLHPDDPANGHPRKASAGDWLAAIARARVVSAPTEGLGTRFAFEDAALVGGGLWHAGGPAHVAAFGWGA